MANPAQFVGLLLGSPDLLPDHWTRFSDRIVNDPAVLTENLSRGGRGRKCARAGDIGLQLNLSWSPPQQGEVVVFGILRTKHLSDVSVYPEVTLGVLLLIHV
jgi:hypothetical protein